MENHTSLNSSLGYTPYLYNLYVLEIYIKLFKLNVIIIEKIISRFPEKIINITNSHRGARFQQLSL